MKYNHIYHLVLYWLASCTIYPVDAHILHQTAMARYSGAKRDFKTAHNRYQTLFFSQQHARVPVYAYRGYLLYLNDVSKYHDIVQLIPEVESSFTQDPDILLLMAQALANVGKVDEFSKKVIELSGRFKDHPEIIFCAAQVYVQNKEPRNALKIIDTLLNTPPHRPSDRIFSLLKAQIHAQLQENKEALETIQTCLELYPTFDRGWLFYAMLQEQKEALDQAITGYRNFLEFTDQPNKQIEQHLLRLALQKSARDQNKKTLNVSRSCLQEAMAKFSSKDYAGALQALDACLKENPKNIDGRIMKIQVLSSMQRLDEVATLLTAWIDEDPTAPLWFQTMHMVCRIGLTYQQAYRATSTITQKHPDALLSHLYAAEYATRTHMHEQALGHCKQALTLTSDTALQARIYFHMGMLYYRDNKLEYAIRLLEQGANAKTPYAPLHNLLAYCYITHAHDIERAQMQSDRACALDPDNPHYWDTQAAILYEKKEYAPAQALLEKALHKSPKNPLILEHLAKTLYKNGQHSRAYDTLQQAHTYAHLQHDKERMSALQKEWDTITLHEKRS